MPPALAAQLQALRTSLASVEARAESREVELFRAERAVADASDAAEAGIRAHFEAALRVRDDALRAARAEIVDLHDSFAQLQRMLDWQQQQQQQQQTQGGSSAVTATSVARRVYR